MKDERETRVHRVEAVVQARTSDEEPWVDQGTISGFGMPLTAFERVAWQYLRTYRKSPSSLIESRVVERTITYSDRPLGSTWA